VTLYMYFCYDYFTVLEIFISVSISVSVDKNSDDTAGLPSNRSDCCAPPIG
jgi:hypothetical protein